MNCRIYSLSLVATACPLMQGCLTESLWKEHYDQQVTVASDNIVEAIYVQTIPGEGEQAALFLLYRPAPLAGEQSSPDAPVPGSSGVIVFRAPETQIMKANEGKWQHSEEWR